MIHYDLRNEFHIESPVAQGATDDEMSSPYRSVEEHRPARVVSVTLLLFERRFPGVHPG